MCQLRKFFPLQLVEISMSLYVDFYTFNSLYAGSFIMLLLLSADLFFKINYQSVKHRFCCT